LNGPVEVGVSCGGVWWPPECFQAIEEVGLDTIWTGEHIIFHRPILDSTTLLAAVATVTKRVRIGPAAIMVTLRHPTLLAKELTTIDRISGGRLVVVAAAGGDFPKEFEALGVPLERRLQRTFETVEIMRRYWTGEHFSYAGEIYQLEDVWMDPTPRQPGGPPIWLAGRTDGALRRAAQIGDGFMPYMYTANRCAQAFEQVRAEASKSGRTLDGDFTWSAHVYVSVDDDPERARGLGIRDLSWRYGKDFTPWIDKYCIHGTPERVAMLLREFVAAGVQHVAVTLVHERSVAIETAPSAEEAGSALRMIERFGREVAPAVRQRSVT
jgi:alkanesulfonate monooxygenase SsuD/methylene tetrahydromethanopterin reductase-like flavin-dependent oxidoreductase (luciferase family)